MSAFRVFRVKWTIPSEVASFEQVFEGDLKGSYNSIEHDLSLFIWPLALIVHSISVPLRKTASATYSGRSSAAGRRALSHI